MAVELRLLSHHTQLQEEADRLIFLCMAKEAAATGTTRITCTAASSSQEQVEARQTTDIRGVEPDLEEE